ncbi:hypothetical protein PQZ63_gp29 [Klebsiella phage pKp383]|uniref:hypothetical protein n=1 Tax=Klebsiella phage pKp383 TaxID=2961985 RepID=UPI00232DEE00|nr:hypothetical protein PQZ63_gp29 [Klebsiella phage pKp383]UVD41526.1 hypothetical protein [Klebsiella phage pKp383]
MSDKCYTCGHAFGLLEERYNVRSQEKKGMIYRKIGEACINCVESTNCKVTFRLWKGDVLPEPVQ